MIERIISEQLGVEIDAVTNDKNLMNDLGADSLNIVQLIMDIEEEFDIEIMDEDAESLHTVGDIRKYIEDNT